MASTVERETWGRKLDFLLSCVGYAVGLGNLWRFPYLCMRNGGGAFLIPYLIFLCLCGIPLFFLELILGQYSRLSPLAIWEKICPIFKGIGYGSVMVSGILCIYYNLILAWTVYYIAKSFTINELPWASCDNWWNTEACTFRMRGVDTNSSLNTTVLNQSGSFPNGSLIKHVYSSAASPASEHKPATPAEEFWHYNVLSLSGGIDEPGEFRWQLFLCLMAAWIIIFLCLFRGIKTSGKVVYVTAVAPYIMLVVFLIRGITLDGAWNGIKFYLLPDFNKLKNFNVWIEACSQIFYSLGPAYGTLITMSSYNRFNNNCYRDAILIPIINCGTSVFAGFVIFSVIGFMAKQAGVEVADVATAGPGLAFVVYPEALTQLPVSQLWSVIFFSMLLMIGLDTQFGMFETMISGFVDVFPKQIGTSSSRKTLFTGLMCVVQFGLGLPLVMQPRYTSIEMQVSEATMEKTRIVPPGLVYPKESYILCLAITKGEASKHSVWAACSGGIYVFQLMDWYSATFSLMTIGFLECVVVSWIYGLGQLYEDIYDMIGYKPNIWWKVCWCFITPLLLLIVLIFTLVKFSQPTYGDYTYPPWAIGLGWFLAVISLIPIPVMALVKILQSTGSLSERLQYLFKPSPDYRYSTKVTLPNQTTFLPVESTVESTEKPDVHNQLIEPFTEKYA